MKYMAARIQFFEYIKNTLLEYVFIRIQRIHIKIHNEYIRIHIKYNIFKYDPIYLIRQISSVWHHLSPF